jgi:hypothetical protein
MKRAGLWAIVIAGLTSLGPLAVEQGYAGEQDKDARWLRLTGSICSPDQQRCSPQHLDYQGQRLRWPQAPDFIFSTETARGSTL